MKYKYPKPKNDFQKRLIEEIKARRAGQPEVTVDDIVGIWNLPMTSDKYIRQMRDGSLEPK